jgi:hypothetical protein
MAIPVVRYFGAAFSFLFEMLGVLDEHLFIFLGIWRPVKDLKMHLENGA